ncbi:MAG TPA: AAA family ATPase [Verrucomicrobiae bacterium]|nr:AAA family ATPase [Verrucomicrobiae bacterium]
MYEEFFGHFGLQRNPFHVSPNPKSFYSTPVHDEALSQLVFGIEARQGLMVLTGEPGTGKTTILHYLLEWLLKQRYSSAYLFQTLVPSMDLLRLILREFGVTCDSQHKGDLLVALKDWLVKRHGLGDCPVILIDEAQGLTTRGLDELRMLLNLEQSGVKLVQLVLAGQPQLEEKLKWRKLAQLRQRIMCHCRLRPLTPEETAGYIRTRLGGAGAGATAVFPQEAVDEIYRYSQGIPRVIHLLCEHALLASYADRRDAVTSGDILHVAQQFELVAQTKEEADAFRSDTFCRLIPFPKIGAGVARQKEHWPKPIAPNPASEAATAPVAPVPEITKLAIAAVIPPAAKKNLAAELLKAAGGMAPLSVQSSHIPVPPARSTTPVKKIAAPKPAIERPSLSEEFLAYWRAVTRTLNTDALREVLSAKIRRVLLRPKHPAASAKKIATPKPFAAKPSMSGEFTRYWRAVGKSLARDVRPFVEQCTIWLRGPVPKRSARPHAPIASVSNWLRRPFGTPQVPNRPKLSATARRVSSASSKHF